LWRLPSPALFLYRRESFHAGVRDGSAKQRGELLTSLMARAKTKRKKEEPEIVVNSIAFTRDTQETLQRLSGEASDYTGRKVSGSAIVRALLRFAGKQQYDWVISQVCPLVEEELASGVTWGSKKK
jgi:hypothetical protein